MARTRKLLPSSETLWTTTALPNGNVYYTTSDKARTKYSLYAQQDGFVECIATASTPDKFKNKIV